MLNKILIDFTEGEELEPEMVAENFYMLRAAIADGVAVLTPTTAAARLKPIKGFSYPEAAGKSLILTLTARRLTEGAYTPAARIGAYIGVYPQGREQQPFTAGYDRYSPVRNLNFSGDDWQTFRLQKQIPDDLTAGTIEALQDTSVVTAYITTQTSVNPIEIKDIKFTLAESVMDKIRLDFTEGGYV